MTESFPRQQARTRRFSLGVPRAFTISPDGTRVVFLRTKSGADPVTCLWQLDVASGTERLVADPTALNAADEDLPPEEKARRERAREQSGGIVSYAADAGLRTVVFSLSGRVFTADLTGAGPTGEAASRELTVQTPPDELLVKQDLLALPLREAREQFERAYLQQQLLLCNGKVGQLAKRVGMERTHLYRKLRSLGVDFRNISED